MDVAGERWRPAVVRISTTKLLMQQLAGKKAKLVSMNIRS